MRYDSEKIGNIIRAERKKLGMTQDELGKKLFVSGKQISNYEKGTPLPSLETLLTMADVFQCELGYLLGEESYKDGSRLNTLICDYLGLSKEAVESLRAATYKGVREELEERQHHISRLFESPHLADFFDCFVDAAVINGRSDAFSTSFEQSLTNRYGEKTAMKAILFHMSGGDLSEEDKDTEELREAIKEFDAAIDESRSDDYSLKVARYELREAFERLVRNIV